MEWYGLAEVALVAVVIIAQLPAIRRQWLEAPDESARGLRIAAYYLLFIGVGLMVLISALMTSRAPAHAFLAGVAFFLGWVTLGVSWIIKVAPKKDGADPVRVSQPLNALDGVALAAIVLSLPFLLTL